MSISQAGFYGGAIYVSGTGPFNVAKGLTVFRIDASAETAVFLPDARLFKPGGAIFYIWADGLGNLNLADNDSGFLLFIPVNNIATVYLTDNSTAAGTWETSLRLKNSAITGKIIQRDIYVIGTGPSPGVAVNSQYDFSASTWNAANRPALRRSHVIALRLGNFIYAVGDELAGSDSKAIERYQFDSWSSGFTASTFNHAKGAGQSLNSLGYVFGGEGTPDSELYNDLVDTWTTINTMPHERSECACDKAGERLFIFAGLPKTQPSIKYFPFDDTYENITDYTAFNRQELTAFPIKHLLYIAGGWDGASAYSNDVEEYNSITDTWTASTDLPAERYAGSGASDIAIGYYCGGYDNTDTATMTSSDFRVATWSALGSMPANQVNTICAGASL